MATSERVFYVVSAALLFVGGAFFIWGGSQHPPTDARLGVVGSDEFFRNFVRHVAEHRNWEAIHTGILVGPLCWALGGVGARLALRRHGESCFSVLGATVRGRAVKQLIGAIGILLGAWPIVAWAIGVFDPGPFTSRWWPLTALLATAWFMAMGVIVLVHGTSRAVEARASP